MFVDGGVEFQGAKPTDIGVGDIWEGRWCYLICTVSGKQSLE